MFPAHPAQPGEVALLFAFAASKISPFSLAYSLNEVNHRVHRGPIVDGSRKQLNFGNTFLSILVANAVMPIRVIKYPNKQI